MADQNQSPTMAALITLHRGLARQGPGDAAFSRAILAQLPALPKPPQIADLGCGTGAATLLLANWFNTEVLAVDLCREFLDQLERHAEAQGIRHLVHPVEGDMGNLDWPPASLDLLWSEGAAYNLTLSGALTAWRPWLKVGALAVISELSWFTEDIPEPARTYWLKAYPAIASESENAARAIAAGFQVLRIDRLPSAAWWENYYNPLQQNMQIYKATADPIMQAVIQETETEMALFQRYSDSYGYSFYVLEAR